MFHAVDDAVSGTEYPAAVPRVKVWTPVPVLVTIERLRPPEVDVANVCEATADPLREVIDPPAPPASVPQEKVPLAQRSFSVELLHSVKLAPKRAARVRPPVLEALVK